ncbi:MAG: PIG-L deacetylase family protein [Terriglobia bacterium]
MSSKITRRAALGWAGAAAAGVPLFGSPATQAQPESGASTPPDDLPEIDRKKKLKVVFAGAHVDDWTLIGGTLARYARLGHEVLVLSFTPGDSQSMADSNHMSVEKIAAMRRAQAVKGCRIIGSNIRFLGQHNEQMHTDPATYLKFDKILLAEKPDVVFTHWAIEFHPDHRAASNLVFNAWLQSGMKFGFYFCENPDAGEMESQHFVPNHYVDVESVKALKRESYLVNTFITDGWPENDQCWKFRGLEYGCPYAEAFIRVHTVATMPERNLYPNWWYWGGLRLAQD